ncbi:MAG: class I SAM-dependent methyltransferase [Desulfovibrio sp.]|nr:class I SAM-dependent methyltransferase [Desulfovibrio sp.]
MSQRAEFLREKIRRSQGREETVADVYRELKALRYEQRLWQKTARAVENILHAPDTGYGELALLCDRYGCNKGSLSKSGKHHPYYPMPPHTYTEVYETLFAPVRLTARHVFECGVGMESHEPRTGSGGRAGTGASLRVWQDFFPHAEIWGGDIDPETLFQEGRIHTALLDQTSSESVKAFFTNTGVADFDIMIDDGLHTFQAARCLFDHAEPYLASGGLYIIEDLSTEFIHKFQQHMCKREGFATKYLLMETPDCWANNLIVVRKS